MKAFLDQIRALIATGNYEITAHAFGELNNDGLLAEDVVSGIVDAVVVEAYPDYYKGPSILVLQNDRYGEPLHALWGLAKGMTSPAYLVTAYRPDPDRWTTDFLRRKLK